VVDELLEAFASEYPFPLDPFQREAIAHLAEDRSVLVAAPTGTGKTIVAEFAIWLAHRQGKRVIYTAPLKALSNQKFRDLRARYGAQMVGLVTGDIVERNQAPILVMTTEIYRNMLLEEEARDQDRTRSVPPGAGEATALAEKANEARAEGQVTETAPQPQPFIARLNPELDDVGCVIFDELHYLSDPERGPVWEEAIIHSPKHVLLIGLSATVSNADELSLWISRVHRPISLVLHTERAIPLDHYYYIDGRLHLVMNADGKRVERFPKIGGEAKRRHERGEGRIFTFGGEGKGQRRPAASGTSAAQPASAATEQKPRPNEEREAIEPGEILTALRQADLLPCLYFLPGRRIVEESASSAAGHLLTTPEEQTLLQEEVRAWLEALPSEDRELDQVQRLTALLPRGLAYHHAGLLPGLKVLVETLFQRGHLRAVFATDTLALGINMPARSVVVGSLSKFDGIGMRLLTPNEYQQLTGRAGRRGMDERGAAIIPYSPWEPFEPSFAALTGELLPVNSAFTMRYNSVLNLWRGGDIRRLRRDVAASFREFQRYSHRLLYEERLAQQELPSLSAEEQAFVEALSSPGGPSAASLSRRARRERKKPPAERERHRALSRAGAAELNGIINLLRSLSYIDPNDRLTIKGRLLRSIFHPAGILFTELIQAIPLEQLHPSELAELASWFAFDDDRPVRNRNTLWRQLAYLRREVYQVIGRVQMSEIELGLDVSPGINDAFHGVALYWWRGASLASLQRHIDLAEGDLLVILNQTIDLLQQVQAAVGQVLDEKRLWQTGDMEDQSERIRAVQIQAARQSLEELRPRLGAAAKGLMRGIVLQSRTVPAMAVQVAEESVPLDMEEDEDKPDLRADIPEEF